MGDKSAKGLADWMADKIGPDKEYASNYDVARAANLSEITIRRIRQGHTPSLRTLQKLADGMSYDMESLQRLAGILEQDKELHDELEIHIKAGVAKLSETNKRVVRELIKTLLAEQQKAS